MKSLAAIDSSQTPFFHSSPLFAMTDYSSGTYRTGSQTDSFSSNKSFSFKKIFRPFKKSRFPFIVLVIVVFVIALFGIVSVIRKSTTNITQTSAQGTSQQVSIAKPLASETLNKEFDFPLKDSTGKEVSKFQYVIQSAELDNQVIIKGEEATAIQGKEFLVINLKITNNYDQAVQLNTRDYIRLIVNNDATEKLAASIHNDPVDVEPISTTFTRLGFPIDANVSNLTLEVGEIDGPKQTIQLNLK